MKIKAQWLCFLALAVPAPAAQAQGPSTAAQWTTLFQNQSSQTWNGGDQDTSTLASNGITYWCFGDTVQGTNAPSGALSAGWTMVGNKILMEKNGVFQTATASSPSVPNDTSGNRYWDDALFEANGFVYVLAQKVQGNTMTCLGMQLAKFAMLPDGTLSFLGMVTTPATGVSGGIGAAANQFSSDAFAADGFIYFFGSTGTGNPYSPSVTDVARVPMVQVENASAWQFWNGTDWVTGGMSQCKAILSDGITSAKRIGGRWVLLHKPFGPYGLDVYAEVGPSPTGPWTTTDIFQSAGVSGKPTGQNYVTYYLELHPEKALSSGKLLVSISWNGTNLSDVAANSSLYKPRFYGVSLNSVLTTGTVHELAPLCAPGSRLEEYGTGQTSGTKTDLWARNGNLNQKWRMDWVGPDFWSFTPQSAPSLRLDDSGSRTNNGNGIDVTTASSIPAQQWLVGDQGNGIFTLSPRCAAGKMLDVSGGSGLNGTQIQIWDFFPAWNEQLWQIL